MDAEFDDGPDDVAALRQALTAARTQALAAEQQHLDTAAELAVTLRVPDPNMFGDLVSASVANNGFQTTDTNQMPLGRLNRPAGDPAPRYNCYRGLGLAEMLTAINEGKRHRCSGEIAFHALEVMLTIEKPAKLHRLIDIESKCVRPDALSAAEASRLLVKSAAI
jgi:hypothetical protein